MPRPGAFPVPPRRRRRHQTPRRRFDQLPAGRRNATFRLPWHNVNYPERPDLAIEVVWTSGGLNELEIYRKLGVREVWFWRRGRLSVHALHGDVFQELAQSQVLPGI